MNVRISIQAVGRDAVSRSYTGELERDGARWRYLIPCSKKLDFFEATFLVVGGGWIQSIGLWNHCGEEFSAKGIPEALFALVFKDSGLRLRSSRRDDGELGFRTVDADRVWCRLMRAGLAEYDEAQDRFVYLSDQTTAAPGNT
jgi:hypothetical protein